ncbi:reverse transcriptase family protein [Defluviimonas sp. SAOS-178_SWC]|uniref:reverse transcriptase family protein n=1 Tax=Defluviimonas sp. SAOS-178_SWC TaxID=3121287 RepID=UPI0032216858
MNYARILLPLATSLAETDWTEIGIETHLRQRLPVRLERHAPKLARFLVARCPGRVAPDPGRIARLLLDEPRVWRIAEFALRNGIVPDFPLAAARFRPPPPFGSLNLPALDNVDMLATWLGLPARQLVRFADLNALSALSGSHFAIHYRHHLIPRKSGGLRLIEEPKPLLKRLQRRVLHGILDLVPAHPASFGFVPGRNCIGAAARHAGEAVVIAFDLADFFPSIAASRVYGLFRAIGYPRGVARDLAGLCTTRTPREVAQTPGLPMPANLTGRHLPQGAPTSPALANLCANALDRRLAGLAASLDAIYTRYADDLSFSGDRRIVPILTRTVPDIVVEEGFRLNPGKTRIMTAAGRQSVTGITVNQHVNLARADYDRLKAVIHHLGRPGDPRRDDPAFLAHLSGRIGWVEQVNPARGLKLRAHFDALGLA